MHIRFSVFSALEAFSSKEITPVVRHPSLVVARRRRS